MPTYIQGEELDDMPVTWTNAARTLYDYSTGWTFSVKVGEKGQTASFTKTTGITGDDADPNITVTWATTGELNSLAAGKYTVQIEAIRTSDGRSRFLQDELVIEAAVL
jgi:hypothetical protein